MPPPTPAECGGCAPAARPGVAGQTRPDLSRARDWCAKIGRPCEMQREGLVRADPGNPRAGAQTIARECRTMATVSLNFLSPMCKPELLRNIGKMHVGDPELVKWITY